MELFEAIRREYQFGVGTIKGVARKLGIHRRMVREALADAVPKERKIVERVRPKLEPAIAFIDTILETDLNAPRKQRHTARRIFNRLRIEKPSIEVAEATVRAYVREKKLKIGLIHREIFVPQSYTLGQEGQVDWYEMFAELGGERQKVQIFCLRSMGSAGAFHRAYPHASQQAFLEGHELAFHYFGGVFHLLRYDNLKSAVQRILRGSQREETARFIAFRSHWGYQAEFCNPARGPSCRRALAQRGRSHGRGEGTVIAAGERGIRSGGGSLSGGEQQWLRKGSDELLFGAAGGRNRGRGQDSCQLRGDLASGQVPGTA